MRYCLMNPTVFESWRWLCLWRGQPGRIRVGEDFWARPRPRPQFGGLWGVYRNSTRVCCLWYGPRSIQDLCRRGTHLRTVLASELRDQCTRRLLRPCGSSLRPRQDRCAPNNTQQVIPDQTRCHITVRKPGTPPSTAQSEPTNTHTHTPPRPAAHITSPSLPPHPPHPGSKVPHLLPPQKPLHGKQLPRKLLMPSNPVHERVARATKPRDTPQVLGAVPAPLHGLGVHEARDEVVVRQGHPVPAADLAFLCAGAGG